MLTYEKFYFRGDIWESPAMTVRHGEGSLAVSGIKPWSLGVRAPCPLSVLWVRHLPLPCSQGT
jgi:hypothetical protein